MKIQTLCAVFLAVAAALQANVILADTDIDFNNGMVVVETDENDDLIIPFVEDDEFVIYVFQFEPGTYDDLTDLLQPLCGSGYGFDIGLLKMLSDDWDRWDRDIEDVTGLRVFCESGNDVLMASWLDVPVWAYGGAGDDHLLGGNSRCVFFGGSGDDRIELNYWNYESNYLSGGSDKDFIRGGAGADSLYGDSGDDDLDGGYGNDFVVGGPDDDDISSRGGGANTLLGGPGLDQIYSHGNDYVDGGFDGESDLIFAVGSDEVIGFYYRYLTPRKPNKNFIVRLEEEEVYGGPIIKGKLIQAKF